MTFKTYTENSLFGIIGISSDGNETIIVSVRYETEERAQSFIKQLKFALNLPWL